MLIWPIAILLLLLYSCIYIYILKKNFIFSKIYSSINNRIELEIKIILGLASLKGKKNG